MNDDTSPFTRLPPPPLRTPPFSSMQVRPEGETHQHRRGSSADGIVVGREVYMRSDEQVNVEPEKRSPSILAPQNEYDTVRAGGKTPESAFGMAM